MSLQPDRRAAALIAFALALLLLTPDASATVSRGSAARLALRQLHVRGTRQPVAVFGLPSPVSAGHAVYDAGPDPRSLRRTRVLPEAFGVSTITTFPHARLTRRAWFFWEDLAPSTGYPHPSMLILLDARNGRVLRRERYSWWPLIDGARPAFLSSPTRYTDRRYRIFARHADLVPGPAPAAERARARARAAQTLGTGGDRTNPPDLSSQCLVLAGDFADPDLQANIAEIHHLARSLRLASLDAHSGAEVDAALSAFDRSPCTRVTLFVLGHGVPSTLLSPSGIITFKTVPINGKQVSVRNDDVTGDGLRAILDRHQRLEFNVIIDSCHADLFGALRDAPNVRGFIASAGRDELSPIPRKSTGLADNLVTAISGRLKLWSHSRRLQRDFGPGNVFGVALHAIDRHMPLYEGYKNPHPRLWDGVSLVVGTHDQRVSGKGIPPPSNGCSVNCEITSGCPKYVGTTHSGWLRVVVLAAQNTGGQVTVSPPGTVLRVAGGGGIDRWYCYGSPRTFTFHAQPDPGTIFYGWGGSCHGTSPDCTVTFTRDGGTYRTVEAIAYFSDHSPPP